MKILPAYLVSNDPKSPFFLQQLNWFLKEIDDRFGDMEYHLANNGRSPDISRGQKMALLDELGILDGLVKLNISQKKLATLLSLIINNSPANIEADLVARLNPKGSLKSKRNYEFLVTTFSELKLKKFEEKCQEELAKFDKE